MHYKSKTRHLSQNVIKNKNIRVTKGPDCGSDEHVIYSRSFTGSPLMTEEKNEKRRE